MQRARRWRTVVKWGLLAGAVGVMVVAVVSFRWSISWRSQNAGLATSVGVTAGSLHVARVQIPKHMVFNPGFGVENVRTHTFDELAFRMTPAITQFQGLPQLRIPFWIPFLLTLAPYLLLARADRLAAKRAKAHACPACGYDRAGLAPAAVCPECGKGAEVDVTKS